MIQIQLNENQYNEIVKALEFYMRFHMGQMSMVLQEFDYTKREEAEESVNKILWIKLWDFRTKSLAYEIHNMMMYEQNKVEWIKNVYSHPPLKCTDEPFIRIDFNY